jgi:SAM-dependent methyltransferase
VGSSGGQHVLAARRDAELEAGSDAHYHDAAYYQATYADRGEDVDYYLGIAAELCGDAPQAAVLEYGCGNGRIALPLARIGMSVWGVDRSAVMLADLGRRLEGEPALARRMRLCEGDMREVQLRRRFPLVLCTFNTFLHLYTRDDVERFLARVRAHLAPGGRFVVDVAMPDPEELARDPKKIHRVPRFKHPSTGEVVRYGERFDYDPLRQVLLVAMEFEPRDRPGRGWMTPLAHRQFFPQELEALLHYNGLEVLDVHGDFEVKPPTRDSRELIFHCQKR